MAGQTWTYSSHKLLNRTKQGAKKKGSEVLFDKIFPPGNVFDDSWNKERQDVVEKYKRALPPKRKGKQREKHKQIPLVCESKLEPSPHLYEILDQVEKKIKTKQSSHVKKKKEVAKSRRKRIMDAQTNNNYTGKISDSTAQSDDQENYDGFVVEESKAKKAKQSKTVSPLTEATQIVSNRARKVSSPKSNFVSLHVTQTSLALDDSGVAMPKNQIVQKEYPSIEIPRKSSEPSFLLTHGLLRSPVSPLVMSDDDLLSSFDRCNFQKQFSEPKMVSISSKYDDSVVTPSYLKHLRTEQGSDSSDYTYSYVSTYTDGTSFATASTKTTSSSPPVKLKHFQKKLNSTTCKGKDNIGEVVFPDSISPICQREKEQTPKTKCSNKRVSFRRHKEKQSNLYESVMHPPKCSTKLFDTDFTQTQDLESLEMTSIRSPGNSQVMGTICPEGLPRQQGEALTTLDWVSLGQKEGQRLARISGTPVTGWVNSFHIKGRNKNAIKVSTPVADMLPVSFGLSPIALPNLGVSELGLHFNESKETNTDEIIVPSLMTPTILSGDATWNRECMDIDNDSKMNPEENRSTEKHRERQPEKAMSTEKQSGYEQGKFKMIEEEPDFIHSKRQNRSNNNEKLKLDNTNSHPPHETHDVNGNLQTVTLDRVKKKVTNSLNVFRRHADINNNTPCTEAFAYQRCSDDGTNGTQRDSIQRTASPTFKNIASLISSATIGKRSNDASKKRTKKRLQTADFVRKNEDSTSDDYCEVNTVNEDQALEPVFEVSSKQIPVQKLRCRGVSQSHPKQNSFSVCFINRLCMQSRFEKAAQIE